MAGRGGGAQTPNHDGGTSGGVDEFEAEVGKEDLHLARACLLVARDFNPSLDVEPALGRFEPWARRVAARRADGLDVPSALRRVLALEEGFRGNASDYHDPANSLLDRVLERRVGLPITLAVVWLEVGRRLGEPLVAVGMPGHFLVRHEDALLDPFRGGARLAEAECQRILDAIYGGSVRLAPAMLQPTGDRDVLARVMGNLKSAYARRADLASALRVSDRLLQLNPFAFEEHRDRGILRLEAGDREGARSDLRRYLDAMPRAPDAERVRALLGRAS